MDSMLIRTVLNAEVIFVSINCGGVSCSHCVKKKELSAACDDGNTDVIIALESPL